LRVVLWVAAPLVLRFCFRGRYGGVGFMCGGFGGHVLWCW
jgi:hypothetical protein